MAYANNVVRDTYLTKALYDASGKEYRAVTEALNDLFNSMAFYDGTAFVTEVASGTEQDNIVAALTAMASDFAALEYKGE